MTEKGEDVGMQAIKEAGLVKNKERENKLTHQWDFPRGKRVGKEKDWLGEACVQTDNSAGSLM